MANVGTEQPVKRHFLCFAAIAGEMKRVQASMKEEKEKEKKIYAKMFA